MKKHFLKSGLAIAVSIAFLTSCKKDNTSSVTTPQISFGIKSDNFATTLAATNSNSGLSLSATAATASLTWTSGIANIASFKLEAKKHGVETEITSKNLANVDIFAITPALVSATLDTGTYKEIEVRVVLAKSTTTALPLVLKGSFTTAGGTLVPVELDFNDDATIKAEADDVVVDGTKDLLTTVSMHLNKLLVNVSAAEVDGTTRTNGSIIISSTVNTALYNKIKANLQSCGHSNGFEKHEKSEHKK